MYLEMIINSMGESTMKKTEIRFTGYGGQGIIRCALITGKALALFDNKHATMNQAIGPEARGSACASQLVVSDERVLYPYITAPDILVAMSQEAYSKYEPELASKGILIIDSDLVKPKPVRGKIKMFSVPSTRFAEELGNRVFANLVMLGFFTAVTSVVSTEAMKKALPGLVPDRFIDRNIEAFDKGYKHGQQALKKFKTATAKKPAPKTTKTAKKKSPSKK